MNEQFLERVRAICLALPGTSERLSHGEPTFFIGKKVFTMFANNHHNDGHIAVWIPVPEGAQEGLIGASPHKFYRPPYVGHRGWVGIELAEIDTEELTHHIRTAWKLIAPKKLRAELVDPPHQDSDPIPPQPPSGVTAHRDLTYVPNGHERQKLDLYLPDQGENHPLIIWIHGGAFRMGSKEGHPDRPLHFEYVAQGYALASLNYRLSQHATFPAQIEDCKAAVRWLRAHAEQYKLDPTCFAAWGPSAGGHLAAMLGTAGHVTEFEVGEHLHISSRVQCVVDYFGPTDFLEMDTQRLPDGMIHDDADSPESELVGGPIQENPAKAARANPITFITEDVPPFLVVHGDQDPLVPHGQSVLLVEALEKIEADVTFYTVEGAGHGGFTDPEVPRLTEAFLAKHIGEINIGETERIDHA